MKHAATTFLTILYATALLTASCTLVDFNNPLDPKGKNYLDGDKSCEAEKIRDYDEGAGFFTRPELMVRCDDGAN